MGRSQSYQTSGISSNLGDPCVTNNAFIPSQCLDEISDLTNTRDEHYEIYRRLMGVVSFLGIFGVSVWGCGWQPISYLVKRYVHMRRQQSVYPKDVKLPMQIFSDLIKRINQSCGYTLAYSHGWGWNYRVDDIYSTLLMPLQEITYRSIVR
jgi:hypothetical protein